MEKKDEKYEAKRKTIAAVRVNIGSPEEKKINAALNKIMKKTGLNKQASVIQAIKEYAKSLK